MYSPPEFGRRHVDQHQVHGPRGQASPRPAPPSSSAELAPCPRSCGAWAARSRPCRRGSQSCLSSSPSRAAAGHDLAHGVDHRSLKDRDPSSRQGPHSLGSQAKQLEARRNVSQGLELQSSRRNGSGCSRSMRSAPDPREARAAMEDASFTATRMRTLLPRPQLRHQEAAAA